jgi:cold shock CspA family protein
MSDNETSEQQQLPRITGRVKWFNTKAGFGFITACEGELKDKDVFVHYSSIKVQDDQYKYLVQGEYVDFDLSNSAKGGHEFHATNISGVKGGGLMCEVQRANVEPRVNKPRVYKTPDEQPRINTRNNTREDKSGKKHRTSAK